MEFKATVGKKIEEGIVLNRQDMKTRRAEIKDVTFKINVRKQEIDTIQGKLDKKEEERKAQRRQNLANLDGFEEDEE